MTYDAPIFDTLTSFFEHNCYLHFLEVEHLPTKVFNSLVGVLSKCKTSRLQRLRILDVDSVEDEEKANFFDSLQGLHSLESLYLRSFEIGMKGCTALSKLLNSLSSNITSLHLDSDNLDDACIAILSNAFIRNKKLKMLNLGDNDSNCNRLGHLLGSVISPQLLARISFATSYKYLRRRYFLLGGSIGRQQIVEVFGPRVQLFHLNNGMERI